MRTTALLATAIIAMSETAGAQPRSTEMASWLAAAGVDARSASSSAVHVGAERLLSSGWQVRLAGDYLSGIRATPDDGSTARLNVLGMALLAKYTARVRFMKPYVIGGLAVQHASSRIVALASVDHGTVVVCPVPVPSPCRPDSPVRNPIGTEAGTGPTEVVRPPTPVRVQSPMSDGASEVSLAVYDYPAVVAGLGSTVRLARVTLFIELRAARVAGGQLRGQSYLPITAGLSF